MMNSGSQGKARKRVIKRIVFLFALALVVLAYVATLTTAFASYYGPKPIVVSKEDQQAIANLRAGTKAREKFFDVNNKPIQFAELKVGDKFTITFGALSLQAQLTAANVATVTLPSGTKVLCFPQKDGTNIVTPISGNIIDSFFQQALGVNQPEARLFDPDGNPLKLSALQKVGQPFEFVVGDAILDAVYLGNGTASVTFLRSRNSGAIDLGRFSIAT